MVEETLHGAVQSGNKSEVSSLLLTSNSKINSQDRNGNTPLLLACCIKNESIYNDIVKILIDNGADVNVHNKGFSPLHHAVFYKREESVKRLLEAGAKVTGNLLHIGARSGSSEVIRLLLGDKQYSREVADSVDENGRSAGYVAAQHEHLECLRLLVENGGDLSQSVSTTEETVLDVLFENNVKPVNFLVDIFNSNIHIKKFEEQKPRYYADFSILVPQRAKTRQMNVISSLLVAANAEEKVEVLQHPLIELFLTLKWSRVCYFFYFWIAAYLVFVLSLSVYVSLLTQSYKGVGIVMVAAKCVLIFSATGLLAHGVLQLCLSRKNLWRKYEMWLNMICTILALIVAATTESEDESSLNKMSKWVLHITSVSVLLCWIELMLLIGCLPTYGYYALMFSAVLQNVVKVLLAFICLVIGFALSFSVQFNSYDQFSDPWRALVKTIVMMMGEFEYADLFADKSVESGQTSRVLFLMFIILTSIVLMNLMVGLAVSDIQSLQTESHARKLEKQADFLSQLEKVVTSKHLDWKYIPRWLRNKLMRMHQIENTYELKTSAQFRRSKKLSSKLIDSLVDIAKSQKGKNDAEG